MKRIFTFILALASVIFAQAATYSGTYGNSITWSLNTTTGLLTISGSGSMEEVYMGGEAYPWDDYYESIKKVVISEGITSVGTYAFTGYENLTSVTLPNTLDSICYSSFSSTAITTLTLPSNLHYIESSAFSSCRMLRTFTLSNALEEIPYSMCTNCTSLQQIVIPNNTKTIGRDAFSGCTALANVTLGTGIRTIHMDAFYNTALELDSKNWKNNIFYVDKACIRGGDGFSGAATIKDGTVLIAEDAFSSMSITSVTLPNSLVYINENAFRLCSSLSSVTFGSSLLEIDDNAFENSVITQLQLPDALTRIGAFAFSGCQKIVSVSFGSGLQTIEDNAFYNCKRLTSVVIPDNVTTIKDDAFEGCQVLTDITIGKAVVDMDIWDAFDPRYVKNLTFNAKHVIDRDGGYAILYAGLPNLESVTFGNEVEFIPEQFCHKAVKLKTVTFPSSLKEIDDLAFDGCKSLKKIVIPNKVTKIGCYSFSDCDSLTSVTIGKAIKTICNTAFESSPVKTLVWNAKQANDGPTNLYTFDLLTKITFGNSVEYIPAHLCDGAENLPSVSFPASVKEIGASAFAICTSLKKVTIPKNITKLNSYAFGSCESLKTVTCESSTPATLESGVFSSIAENAMLRVPCGSMSAYVSTTWDNYFSQIDEYSPFTVTISSADESMGVVSQGELDCSTGMMQIEAVPNTGFIFETWSDGNTEPLRTLLVTQDTTLVASFKVQTFAIQFVDWNGTVLQEDEVLYNTLPSAPEAPTRQATAQYTYTFTGWEPEIVPALADTRYTAHYDSVVNEYTITFRNEDGSDIFSRKWAYGEMPSCEEPSKESTEHFAYHFDGWQPAIEIVTGNATYIATFRAVPIHALTFLDWNGDELGVVKVEEGSEALAPVSPMREGYLFNGWSRDLSNVTKDLYVIALYSLDASTALKVHFVDANNQLIMTSHITDAVPAAPIVAEKVFVGWQAVAGDIEDGITVRAVYNDSTPTSFASPSSNGETPRKVIRDGQVYVLLGEKVYTVTGQKVK